MKHNNATQTDKIYPSNRSKLCLNSIGKTFGSLTVLEYLGYRKRPSGVKTSIVTAKCICGKIKRYEIYQLVSGGTKTCGCISNIIAGQKRTKHGHAGGKGFTPEYSAWLSMKQRCYTVTFKQFEDYGGRGIIVCPRWLGVHGFENFLSDMGKRPSTKHSLDRYPNTNGNYEKSNCRWGTDEQQMNNTRRNAFIIYNNERLTMAQVMVKYGLTVWETRKLNISQNGVIYKTNKKCNTKTNIYLTKEK